MNKYIYYYKYKWACALSMTITNLLMVQKISQARKSDADQTHSDTMSTYWGCPRARFRSWSVSEGIISINLSTDSITRKNTDTNKFIFVIELWKMQPSFPYRLLNDIPIRVFYTGYQNWYNALVQLLFPVRSF